MNFFNLSSLPEKDHSIDLTDTTDDECTDLTHSEHKETCQASVASCEVCGDNVSKYRCPQCHLKTCSLTCIKKHKSQSKCTGVRDKTQYVPKDQFGDLQLLSGKFGIMIIQK